LRRLGALLTDRDEESPGLDILCSETLIAPAVFQTASHCLAGIEMPLFVTFAPEYDEDSTSRAGAFSGTGHMDPLSGSGGFSNSFDIAGVLDQASGLTPAQLPRAAPKGRPRRSRGRRDLGAGTCDCRRHRADVRLRSSRRRQRADLRLPRAQPGLLRAQRDDLQRVQLAREVLREGIANLLDPDDRANGEKLMKQLYGHPRVNALIRPVSRRGRARYPSYIPAQTFVAALLDIDVRGTTRAREHDRRGSQRPGTEGADLSLEERPGGRPGFPAKCGAVVRRRDEARLGVVPPPSAARDVAPGCGPRPLTAAALTLAAPFWFDMLSKIARIRSAGAPPPASDAVRKGEGEQTPRRGRRSRRAQREAARRLG
jgi:hypothetical protein